MMNRILFVSNDFAPSVGGIAQVLGHICGSLPPDQVSVIAQSTQGDAEFDKQAPYSIRRVSYSSDSTLQSLLSVARYAKAVRQVCIRENCDLIFYDKAFPLGLISHQPTAPRVPYIVHAHGNDVLTPRSTLEQRLLARILKDAASAIANSNFTKQVLMDIGVNPERIFILHPKLDIARFNTVPDTSKIRKILDLRDKKVILSVGRLVRRKGFDKTIEALPLVLKEVPEATYLIVGNGPDREYLNNLTRMHGVTDKVYFVFDCRDEDLSVYYHACDVFCMPSRYIREKGDVEGFGIVFLEANACQKPVVGGNSGGQPDAIEDGKSGLLCDPESPDDIARKLIAILKNPELAESFGKYGYERATEHFQKHLYGAELQKMIAKICD